MGGKFHLLVSGRQSLLFRTSWRRSHRSVERWSRHRRDYSSWINGCDAQSPLPPHAAPFLEPPAPLRPITPIRLCHRIDARSYGGDPCKTLNGHLPLSLLACCYSQHWRRLASSTRLRDHPRVRRATVQIIRCTGITQDVVPALGAATTTAGRWKARTIGYAPPSKRSG